MRPYSTREVAASFVVQVMVAALAEMPVAVTAEMVGAVVSRTMVSVNAADQLPAASRNWTYTVLTPAPVVSVQALLVA